MYSDDYSEKELQKLERRLQKIYKQANRELTEKARDYFIQFEDRYNEEYLKYQAGVIGKQEFENWVNTQVGRGKRWEKLRDQMAMRLSDTNWLASDYINGTTPRVYAENYNYSAYTIEQTGNNISFTLLDENTVMRLSEGEKDLLPKAKVNIPKDQQWNKKRLQNALLQGILQGDSVTHLADRLQTVTNMNRNSAIRNARTMVTGAQNGGRQRSYENASKMGLEVQKEWMSASDNRVRDSHAQLNGVRVKYTEKFPNGCRYPADPSGRAEEVYNCRCTMVAITPHANQRTRTNNTVASYNKWKQQKEENGLLQNVIKSFVAQKTGETIKYRGKSVDILKTTDKQQQEIDKAINLFSDKEQQILSNYGVQVKVADIDRSFYRNTDKTVYMARDFEKNRGKLGVIHEHAHALYYAMDLQHDAEYNFVIEQGMPDVKKIIDEYNIQLLSGIKEPKLKSNKFITAYQGRIYQPNNTNDTAASLLREYISVGYETYVNDPVTLKKKDHMLYEYIRDYMRG